MKQNGFPKKERLCGDKKIGEMFKKGRSGFVYPFRYMYHSDEEPQDEGNVAVLISVSKRYHKRANKRNLIKRRTREAYRLGKSELRDKESVAGKNISLGLIYSTKDVLDYKVIENAVGKIIARVAENI